ncbi:ADP-ribosylglycohydrolase family protein [Janthinobacterium psychrotolerans]|uniref:ADP-ribosyl-[dinitrogen reductase] hydrolase n=1 Tax=Janthinobacterium psychrotolerans TaxID=1747903 RepID=A0A1A7C5B7_9BURK|nr:ADP-ribosylglycohydrolase family protein [Janthinobacterium psychrotolerans]OBV40229.1 ADP-ribosyl-[dinitrogen reductase] hydrolase [Janthinobacterium psychrotolerans]
MPETTLKSRYLATLLGLAAGDAVGTTVEFSPRGSFTPVTQMTGGGPFGLQPGQWTDDTSMALCLAESLIVKDGFDPADQMTRYLNWWKWGYLSSTGSCFDIGMTVRAALDSFAETGNPYSGDTSPRTAGNGSLMRLAPVVLFAYPDVNEAIRLAADSSRTTHGAPEAVDSCQLFAALLCGALSGVSKEDLLASMSWRPSEPKLKELASGGFVAKAEQDLRGSGYCVDSLEASLWCFFNTGSFEAAVLRAANLGDDADTTAAITGQIAGAYYGVEAIPPAWLSPLAMRGDIEEMAIKLLARARQR